MTRQKTPWTILMWFDKVKFIVYYIFSLSFAVSLIFYDKTVDKIAPERQFI